MGRRAAFAGTFALLSALGNDDNPLVNALISFLYFGSGAFVVLRWGLVSFATAVRERAADQSARDGGLVRVVLREYDDARARSVALTSWGMYTAVLRPGSSRTPA